MLNRITGYLLFAQLSYLTAFIALTLIDLATNHSVFLAFRWLRSALGAEHSLMRISDCLYYPFIFTAPLNVCLALVFLRGLLRDSQTLSLPNHFFSILNAFYLAASGWILFSAFASHLRK
jgi:hypothetical protein